MSDDSILVDRWSCDERKRPRCRNSHGCHCFEITSQPDTAPPADAGMREALGAALCVMKDLRDGLHHEPSVQGRKWVHLGSSLNDAIRKAELAITAPGATTKSDGGDCFWPQCSDRKRCTEYGSCVALAQRKAIAAGDLPSRPSDPSSTRSEVTVEGIARIINPDAFCSNPDPDEPEFWRKAARHLAREKARAILATGPVAGEAAVRADEREKCAKIADAKSDAVMAEAEAAHEDKNYDLYERLECQAGDYADLAAAIRSQEAGR